MSLCSLTVGVWLMADRERLLTPWLPRVLVVPLALGGCYWGLLLLPGLAQPNVESWAFALFGPGYLLTLGYIVRAISTPPLWGRRFLWVLSLLVQGGWFCYDFGGGIMQVMAGRHFNEPILILAWWAFAAVASGVALFAEGHERRDKPGAASDRPRD